jgi:hypothetical protein
MLRRVVINLAVLCVGIFVALAAAEIFVRLLHPLSTVEYLIDSNVGPILAPHQKSRWVNQDYDVTIVTNSAGFHDGEHVLQKPSDFYRIVVLGDSFVEALQVPVADGFCQQLERVLKASVHRSRVEVVNLAISGTGPAQQYRVLETMGLRYQPDLVVMVVLPDNDFRDSSQRLSGSVAKPYYAVDSDGMLRYIPPQESGVGVALMPWLRRSALLHLIRQAIATTPVEERLATIGLLSPASGVRSDYTYPSIPLDWHVYLADLPEAWLDAYRITHRMIHESKLLAEQHNAKFLVVLIGSPATIEDRWKETLASYSGTDQVKWDFERPYRAIEKLGRDVGFAVVNLVEPFQRDYQQHQVSHAWPHDGHWNPRGHKLAAEVVGSFLLAQQAQYGID